MDAFDGVWRHRCRDHRVHSAKDAYVEPCDRTPAGLSRARQYPGICNKPTTHADDRVQKFVVGFRELANECHDGVRCEEGLHGEDVLMRMDGRDLRHAVHDEQLDVDVRWRWRPGLVA